MKRIFIAVFIFAQFTLLQGAEPVAKSKPATDSALAPIEEVAGLPRVLLIGDSVSIGYTLPTRELLNGVANVHRPPTNCSSTGHGLQYLKAWLGNKKWDVIHFNFGLHDAKLPPEGVRHAPPAEYEKNLHELLRQMRETGAKLIFATTTPVPNGGNLSPTRRFGDVDQYNAVAKKVMSETSVTINDLNAAISPHVEKVQRTNDVHFTDEGSALLARQVADAVKSQLGIRASNTPRLKPNILFIIADDASPHFGQAYGCSWVKTLNIDRLARGGLVFDNTYTPTAKCAPSRAAILTGRNPWQLEEAANHQSQFPAKFMAFSEALGAAGVHVGSHGKIWGPGSALTADGQPRSFGLKDESNGKSFETFLKNHHAGTPFFYWFGSHNPHRSYKKDSGIASGKKTSDIDRVPRIWPDSDVVRRDMLDYAVEVEAFDSEVGTLLQALEASGEASNTLVVVTSDNGMPFPRSKGHNYDISNREPMVARWPDGIANPGRRVSDFLSFIDLAPTFLELLGVDGAKAGMAPMTGSSFANLLRGESDPSRTFVVLGRERNDVEARPGTPSGLGYPVRAIREGDLFYIHNFAADRWPCGDPELGLLDTDASPTKTLITELGEQDRFWQMSFGKRPQTELYDLRKDPDCVENVANDQAYSANATALRDKLFAELKKQNDPRVLGGGGIFDDYVSPKSNAKQKKRQ